jgi:Bifunctional DNA primase/polymerase, N-terminal/Protein of unknown function (DUF3987)/Primase C terminal 1 (PriCT-1)
MATYGTTFGRSPEPIIPAAEPNQTQREAAVLRLASRGLRLFPVQARSKHPLIAAWPQQATSEPLRLREWMQKDPHCNWGVATGRDSGIFVLDVDGDQGLAAIEELRKHGYGLPPTLAVKTGRGCHYYFRYPEDALIRNSAGKLGPGLDIRGDGGYVLVPPSVHPSDTDYQWIHEVAVAPAPDWLLERLKAQSPSSTSAPVSDGNDVIPEGERNVSLASLAGTMRKRGMTLGAIEAALLTENVERCKPPLPDAEVREIASSISRHKPAGPIVARSITAASPRWPEPLNLAALHGLAGEFVNAVEPYTESDPAALLIQLLTALGSVAGRNPYYLVEEDRHFLNLFTAMAGPTAKARKGTSYAHVIRPFKTIDPEWSSHIRPGLSSGEGLIHAVRDGTVDDPGVSDKRLLVMEPELASVLQVMARQGNTLSAVVRQGWDSGKMGSLTKNSTETATDAHVSIIGHITVEELRRYLDRTEAANGFANRFLFMCVRRSKALPDGGRVPDDVIHYLTHRLAEVVSYARGVGQMARDEDACEIWRQVYEELSEGSVGLFGAVTSRAEAQVVRLSCLYALLDSSAIVTGTHLKAALALWDYSEASAMYIFGEVLGDAVADELFRALRNNLEGLTRTAVRDLFSRHGNGHQLDRALRVLAELGRARCVKEDTGGRPLERWFAIATKAT